MTFLCYSLFALEGCMDLAVVHSEADDGLHLLACKLDEGRVVIAFVRTTNDPDHWSCLALKSVPRCIDICGL